MKSSILLAAAALCAASAADARVAPPLRMPEAVALPAPRHGAPNVPRDCAITVSFGSFGAGTDRATLERMERRLRTDRRVRNVTRHPWGREGELTLCVRLARAIDVYRVGRDLDAMVPARPRGPVQVDYPRRRSSPR